MNGFFSKKIFCYFIVFCVFASCANFSIASDVFFDDSVSPDDAYKYGLLLRAQYRNKEARKYLKYAVDSGSVSAGYLYAIELRSYNKTVRTDFEVFDYVVAAAKSGNDKAMRYLALREVDFIDEDQSFWRGEYLSFLDALVEQDEAAAHFGYFLFYMLEDPDLAEASLEKAAALEHPVAMMVEGDRVKAGGGGFYLFASSRSKAALSFYEAAAKTGYLPSMKKYVTELRKVGNQKKAFEWLVKTADSGELSSIALVAKVFSGSNTSYGDVDLDSIKAKAYYDMYFEVAGRDRFSFLYDSMLVEYDDLLKKMSDEQVIQADEMFETLKDESEEVYAADFYWFDDGYFYSFLK